MQNSQITRIWYLFLQHHQEFLQERYVWEIWLSAVKYFRNVAALKSFRNLVFEIELIVQAKIIIRVKYLLV